MRRISAASDSGGPNHSAGYSSPTRTADGGEVGTEPPVSGPGTSRPGLPAPRVGVVGPADDTLLAEAILVGGPDPELLEDHAGVLAHPGWRPEDPARGVGEADGVPELAKPAQQGVLVLGD